jgi:hypothetical protein
MVRFCAETDSGISFLKAFLRSSWSLVCIGGFHFQRTEECLGQASATDLTPEIQLLIDDLDVVHERNYKILLATEKMLKRNPGLTSQEYIYQIKEKKNSTRTNALIQLGSEMIFAGRHFGDATTYGKIPVRLHSSSMTPSFF